MQTIRTLTLLVLCVFALSCTDVVLAENSVVDASGKVWCVRSEENPLPAMGQEIYLFDEDETFGEFITADKITDTTPHVYLTPAGKIGIVWSRENVTTGKMEICSTTYDQVSGLWVYPFTVLTSSSGDVDHTDPRMEISPSGTAHLVYVSISTKHGQMFSRLVYRSCENGVWSEPAIVSSTNEIAENPEIYLGASEQGYPLVLVFMSRHPFVGSHVGLSAQPYNIKVIQKGGADPGPWTKMDKHRLPINLR